MKIRFFLLFTFFAFSAFAKNIEVCPSCTIKKIQNAIDIAKEGDVIIIKPGTYKENNITITQNNIQIKGIGRPIIDGEMTGTVMLFKATDFVLSGIKIINVGHSYTKNFAAVLVTKSERFEINDVILENVFFGFLIEKSKHGIIQNCTASSSYKDEAGAGNGVHLWNCSDLIVKGNNLHGMRDGIYLEFVKRSKIIDNYSHNNIRYGLHFMFSNNDEYSHNKFENNGAGVAVMFSKYIKMHHNKFMLNWGASSYGLLLKEIYDAEIHDNDFVKNTTGINIEGSTRINYSNNNFKNNGWAINVTGACYKNLFYENNFLHNSFDISYKGNLNSNQFNNNYWSEYTGYDLDRDNVGDIPYRPVKLFSYIVNTTPETIVLLRSLFVDIINFSEKVSPVFTPDQLIDDSPAMTPIPKRTSQ